MKEKISIVTGCLNEVGNLQEFYDRVVTVMNSLPAYSFEIIVADNNSKDGSRELLRQIAAKDKAVKVILNSNNFGPVRSGFNAFLQATGDAVILMSSDLQDPPEVIRELVEKWESNYQVVVAVKTYSAESPWMDGLRWLYYVLLSAVSDSDYVIRGFTGFGLYDRKFMEALKLYREPLPYLRGLVSKIGFRQATVGFIQPKRKAGRSKHNIFSLYDVAMTGFVTHSKLPLRLSIFTGFVLGAIALLIAAWFFYLKLTHWDSFRLGLAPLVIGMFFFSAVQLIFIGIIGEYIGAILTQVKNQPLAIVDERINFDSVDGP